MIDLKDIYPLTDFQRNTKEFVRQMKEKKTPLVLTVNGWAEVIVQDAEAYQEVMERLERAEALQGIQRGLDEFEQGQGRPAREAPEELRAKHGIPH
jgi:prevent-host-death family protein